MFKRNFAMILAIASFINPVLVLADEANPKITSNLTQPVSNKYLTSMFGEKEIVQPTTTMIDPNAGFMENFKKLIDPKIQHLTSREVQETAFDLVSSTRNYSTTIIDSSCIDKLEIVGGGENSTQHLFGNVFKHINTAMGKAHAAFIFCHPITDIQTLNNRQHTIIHLSENKDLFEHAAASLKKMSSFEIKSSIFWHSKSPVNPETIKYSYFGQQYDIAGILKQLNTNTAALEFTNKTGFIASAAIGACYIPLFGAYIINLGAKDKKISFTQALQSSMAYFYNESSATTKASVAFAAALQCFIAYTTAMTVKSSQETYNHLQDILIATSSHIKELKKLSSLINKKPELLTYLPSLQPLADFNKSAKQSAKLTKLLGMLDTNTFQGEASFFSITGRVLAAYELMKQVKDELAPVFAAAGELDMYVALAKLYNEHEDKNARYCMVDFVENSATPVIKAEGFWNPFIDADKVVINNATFDLSCPNSILTGPNTGGKSTVIKAIMLDVLMAQTFGIAPAQSLSMTPFAKLNCFMNISDDIATGASLFKSEVMRAKKLLDLVQSLKQDEFSFVIIDEVFTGTSPKEGEQAALQFAKKLGLYTNNISIIATHYPKMVDLEKETKGNYRNHHVEILRNEDGSLNRTFKLKNGPSFMNVAFDILEEEGLFV